MLQTKLYLACLLNGLVNPSALYSHAIAACLRCKDGVEVPFFLSVFATAHPVYGNRNGSTQLNIAMLNTQNSSYNLQLKLEKYIDTNAKSYSIWHNGIRSRMKKEYTGDGS